MLEATKSLKTGPLPPEKRTQLSGKGKAKGIEGRMTSIDLGSHGGACVEKTKGPRKWKRYREKRDRKDVKGRGGTGKNIETWSPTKKDEYWGGVQTKGVLITN